jgi:signal transduction histidine kinase
MYGHRVSAELLRSRVTRSGWFWVDAVVAAALVVIVLVATARAGHGGAVPFVAGLVNATTALWQRKAPAIATVAAGVALVAFDRSSGTDLAALPVPVALGACLVGRRAGERGLRRAEAAPVVAVAVVAVPLIALVPDNRTLAAVASVWVLVMAFPIAAGYAIGNYSCLARRLAADQEILRAEQRESARQVIALERARIARELHDVVAHNVSVIVIQTQAARRVMARDHVAALGVLETVVRCGREALAELRRMIGARQHEDIELPVPGVARLRELAELASKAGLSVETTVTGAHRPLRPEIELTVYRIVQEALTNVIKHTSHVSASVALPRRWPVLLRVPGAGPAAIGDRGRQMSAVPWRTTARSPWFDALLAAAALTACEAEVLSRLDPGQRHHVIFFGLLVAAVTVPLAFRRRWPLVVACMTTVAAVVLLAIASFTNILSPTPVIFVSLYSVAAYEPLGRAIAGISFFTLTLTGGVLVANGRAGSLVFGLAVGGACWLAGRAMRARRHLVAELRRTSRLIAAERSGREALTVLAERNRITRELQVLVAESISSMVVYGHTALLQLERDDPGADQTMACIEELGRQAMQQMRSMIEVLRRDHDGTALKPTPGIDQVYELIDILRDHGHQVELRVEGEPRPLPALIDVCAYRILADLLPLPDAARRPQCGASIVLRFTAADLELLVTADSPQPSDTVLATIGERVHACNGRIDTADTGNGARQLVITLPCNLERVLA